VEPEKENTQPTSEATDILQGVGHKNPTIHVLDSLMGQGKSTALIEMIRLECQITVGVNEVAPAGGSTMPVTRWLVIVPTLAEADRYKAALDSFGSPFELPNDTIHGRKTLHLLQLVKEGRNIVATHALFNKLSRQVYEAIEALDYTLYQDSLIRTHGPNCEGRWT
jgi:hypothetical protein